MWCLCILTWKCASRHSGVHFFDISNSETVRCRPETYVFLSCFTPHFRFAPNLVCFAQFDLETCFAPQRRALFQHLNFQNCSEPVSFLHFSLPNVLRATTACYFSSLAFPTSAVLSVHIVGSLTSKLPSITCFFNLFF